MTVFVLFIGATVGFSQSTLPNLDQKKDIHNLYNVQEIKHTFRPEINTTGKVKTIPGFKASELPLFCKFEYKMEKSSKLNLRMRLGDLNYVNKLENK